jgi:hypothetical protein
MNTKKTLFLIVVFILFALLAKNYRSGNGLEGRCDYVADEKKSKCWQDLVSEVLDKKGLDGAFDLVSAIYAEEPTFRANCHDYVHLIGKTAYVLFSQGKDFKVNDKTAFCAYGFYHGFMENLVSDRGDVTLAREFCREVDKQLKDKSPSAELACYHGIGHGWTNVHDEKLWGDERAMVYPALELCEKATQDEHQLEICATGVFDSISIGYYNEAYGLKIKKDDPLWLCREQEDRFKAPCYADMMPALIWLGGYDLEKSLYYMRFVEEPYLEVSVEGLAENSVRFILAENKNPQEYVSVCRKLKSQSQATSCIRGLGSGVMQFGPPGEEYIEAIKFCAEAGLNDWEKDACFQKVLNYVKSRYYTDKSQEICLNMEDRYRHYCKVE